MSAASELRLISTPDAAGRIIDRGADEIDRLTARLAVVEAANRANQEQTIVSDNERIVAEKRLAEVEGHAADYLRRLNTADARLALAIGALRNALLTLEMIGLTFPAGDEALREVVKFARRAVDETREALTQLEKSNG